MCDSSLLSTAQTLDENQLYLTAMDQVNQGLVHCRTMRSETSETQPLISIVVTHTNPLIHTHNTYSLTHTHTHTHTHSHTQHMHTLTHTHTPTHSHPHSHTNTHTSRTEMLQCHSDADFLAKLFCVRLAFDEILSSHTNRNYFKQLGRDLMALFLQSANKVAHSKEEAKY